MNTALPVVAGLGSLVLTAAASAGFVGIYGDSYESGGFAVIDVYAQFDTGDDVVLNVFNANISNSDGSGWFHDDPVGGSWNPFLVDSGAIESFVTIGGFGGPFNNSWTTPDPNWGDDGFNQAGIPANAGWFNNNPPNLAGQAQDLGDGMFGTWLGRFVIDLPSSPVSLNFAGSLTFNQGLGTDPEQPSFDASIAYVPAPGALALLGLAGLAGSRRRRA